jgi:phosphoinositide-3-kinase, regulatory subunit 4
MNALKPKRTAMKTNQAASILSWKPSLSATTLIGNFNEHKGPITGLSVSPDQAFFTTCSEDGTVKIWDISRLEKNVCNFSRLSYRREDVLVKYKCMCMAENSHCIFVASDDGKIEVLKVEMFAGQIFPQYEHLRLLKTFQLENEVCVQLEHFRKGILSLLIFCATLIEF